MTGVTLPGSTATSQSRASVTRKRFSGPEYSLVPYDTIHDAVHALIPRPSRARASWAVVPIENSYFGPVVQTREIYRSPKRFDICTRTLDERIRLKVEHCLIARKPSTPAKSSPSPSPGRNPIILYEQSIATLRLWDNVKSTSLSITRTPNGGHIFDRGGCDSRRQ
ncbi:hypothetical protein PTTG_05044 [Puccinia triticina 1-1 BBBD Race 1]|uniref:Prephenate dehydratase domain-containing protein n=2 Tax=Puccinia triticina TaxID=208348 RepID=A0A0C4EW54_PUCT1|nr:uncharacterized protein PtA15_7A63 [Puccinia triticina]OAV90596.1 hypothetical protein PTTG_05044 [Puccinia triticina 1-1 BBBD Race 1]WAQ86337.1 hypothetical protein PtA15_7A63 [Puccinia triticina]WAR56216.1 hypothetical protein PtB15_7B61 [Puccinia triticina]